MSSGRVRNFARCTRGQVTLMLALAAIPVMLAGTGAMEMLSISSDRAKLQSAVDAAALTGAGKLSMVTTSTLPLITEAVKQAGQDNYAGKGAASFSSEVSTTLTSVTVTGETEHKAVIGFLGVGNTKISAVATADALQKTPLCVLQVSDGNIDLANTSSIRAPGCLIHADSNISVATSGMITANRVQAVGTATGPMSPKGNAGALPIDDPFIGMDLNPKSLCTVSVNAGIGLGALGAVTPILADTTVPAGVHCLPILAVGSARIHLAPGDHYFMGGLIMTQNSSVDGDDVALIFGPLQIFDFADKAAVRLTARKTGPFAGFLIATTRDNVNTF